MNREWSHPRDVTTLPAYRRTIDWKRWLTLWRNVGILHAQPSAGFAAIRHEKWGSTDGANS